MGFKHLRRSETEEIGYCCVLADVEVSLRETTVGITLDISKDNLYRYRRLVRGEHSFLLRDVWLSQKVPEWPTKGGL